MNRALARGQRLPLNEQQRRLAVKYLPMAMAMAMPSKLAWRGLWDEFESAACMALVEAAESFDPRRNVAFPTFARHRILGAMHDVRRERVVLGYRCDPEEAPTISGLALGEEEEGRFITAMPDTPVGQEIEVVEEVERWLRKLPHRNASACRQLYLHDKTFREAAGALGCSQSRVSGLHREAMAMLNSTREAEARNGRMTAV